MTFMTYCRLISGYDYFNRATGVQIYKWELYWSKIAPEKVLKNYHKVERDKRFEHSISKAFGVDRFR